MVTGLIPSAKLLDLLSMSPEVPGAAAVVEASDDVAFLPRPISTAELLEIYDRRLRMGRLDAVAGGRELVEALRRLQDTEVLMVVVESWAGAASVWVTVNVDSVVGAVAFLASTDQETG